MNYDNISEVETYKELGDTIFSLIEEGDFFAFQRAINMVYPDTDKHELKLFVLGYMDFESVEGEKIIFSKRKRKRKYNYIDFICRVENIKDVHKLNKDSFCDLLNTTYSEIVKKNLPKVIESLGGYYNSKNKPSHVYSAMILKNGDVLQVPYEKHKFFIDFLNKHGICSIGDYRYDNNFIYISSGIISYQSAYNLQRHEKSDYSLESLKTLFNIEGLEYYSDYSFYETTCIKRDVFTCAKNKIGKGGKYGNLKSLEIFYPQWKEYYPEISLTKKLDCIRTSPKYSIPGLLNSIFNIEDDSIFKIKKEFEQYKNVIEGNEINFFYQKFYKGLNGVCHFDGETFTLNSSSNQGDIVKGLYGSGDKIRNDSYLTLKTISERLSDDLQSEIQLEFVDSLEGLRIVQMRYFPFPKHEEDILEIPEDVPILVQGKPFSKGIVTINVEDILVVDDESDSNALLGKKALIVKNGGNFSHILALSKMLKIPSICSVTTFNLPEKGKVVFDANTGIVFEFGG